MSTTLMTSSISREQKRQLVAKAAKLNPVVLIGNKGLTAAVHLEIEHALKAHELIKIRFHSKDHDYQQTSTLAICEQHQAELINKTGHVIVIYRPQPADNG